MQFPDELLRDSVPIFRRLKAKLGEGHELYVLADTSYGRYTYSFHIFCIHLKKNLVAVSTKWLLNM